jgi:hypothetical protein
VAVKKSRRREKKPRVGTIHGAFHGALDGVSARLIRIRKLGYTVELLESKHDFHTGERIHVSCAEFTLEPRPAEGEQVSSPPKKLP